MANIGTIALSAGIGALVGATAGHIIGKVFTRGHDAATETLMTVLTSGAAAAAAAGAAELLSAPATPAAPTAAKAPTTPAALPMPPPAA